MSFAMVYTQFSRLPFLQPKENGVEKPVSKPNEAAIPEVEEKVKGLPSLGPKPKKKVTVSEE